mmetsp:Transcript_6001/g.9219  ORF Transcript_6001/g.9219 Transcript_6001/m.9219 type:complete len:484 (+) Transcript_6001:52-1503(+)
MVEIRERFRCLFPGGCTQGCVGFEPSTENARVCDCGHLKVAHELQTSSSSSSQIRASRPPSPLSGNSTNSLQVPADAVNRVSPPPRTLLLHAPPPLTLPTSLNDTDAVCEITGREQDVEAAPRRSKKYKGVYWESRRGKWRAQVLDGLTRRHVGYFDSEEDAARRLYEASRSLESRLSESTEDDESSTIMDSTPPPSPKSPFSSKKVNEALFFAASLPPSPLPPPPPPSFSSSSPPLFPPPISSPTIMYSRPPPMMTVFTSSSPSSSLTTPPPPPPRNRALVPLYSVPPPITATFRPPDSVPPSPQDHWGHFLSSPSSSSFSPSLPSPASSLNTLPSPSPSSSSSSLSSTPRVVTGSSSSGSRKGRVHRKSKSSRFTGVFWDQKKQKWRAQIQDGPVRKHLGYFDSEDAAASARKGSAVVPFSPSPHVESVDNMSSSPCPSGGGETAATPSSRGSNFSVTGSEPAVLDYEATENETTPMTAVQ